MSNPRRHRTSIPQLVDDNTGLVTASNDAEPMENSPLVSLRSASLQRPDYASITPHHQPSTIGEYADYGDKARTEAETRTAVATAVASDSGLNDWSPIHTGCRLEERHTIPGSPAQDHDLSLLGGNLGLRVSAEPRASYPQNLEITEKSIYKQSLCTRLQNVLVPDKSHPCSNSAFLPRKQLMTICTPEGVVHELMRFQKESPTWSWGPEESPESIADYVCESDDNKHSSREIFAILALIKRVDLILEFKIANIRDCHLPLSRDPDWKTMWYKDLTSRRVLTFMSCMKEDDDDGGDHTMEVRREFFIKQWWIHIPFIGELRHYEYDHGTIMPWTFMSDKPIKGGFGAVHKVRIHEDHHAFNSTTKSTNFALKTLESDEGQPDNVEVNFRQESKALRTLQRDVHIVKLFATFKVGDKCMLLFPWADGGSLGDFWDPKNGEQRLYPADLCLRASDPGTSHGPLALKKTDSRNFMRWITHQCRGIANALAIMHQGSRAHPQSLGLPPAQPTYCRHGDIKPENILYFSNEQRPGNPLGNLKLADFGLAEIHRKTSRSGKPDGPQTWAYRAPEWDMESQPLISLPADVWALGCVFTELLVWVVEGPEAVESYAKARYEELTRSQGSNVWEDENFFFHLPPAPKNDQLEAGASDDPGHVTLLLKRTVRKWCQDVSNNGRVGDGPTFLGQFLTFITDKMLDPSKERRAKAEDVRAFLDACLNWHKDHTAGTYWACNLAARNTEAP